jgi:hypothetical protein
MGVEQIEQRTFQFATAELNAGRLVDEDHGASK